MNENELNQLGGYMCAHKNLGTSLLDCMLYVEKKNRAWDKWRFHHEACFTTYWFMLFEGVPYNHQPYTLSEYIKLAEYALRSEAKYHVKISDTCYRIMKRSENESFLTNLGFDEQVDKYTEAEIKAFDENLWPNCVEKVVNDYE